MSLMTDPKYRELISPEVIIGQRINDVLGEVTPDQAPFQARPNPYYKYHHGDLFFPGAAVWVLEQTIETPLMAQWGNGLLLAPNRGFQAYPPIAPLQTPANLVRVATPWGTASPQWGITMVPEKSSETDDTAGFTPLANVDFMQSAPPYAQQWPGGDYGTPQGYAQNSILPVVMTDYPPNGISNATPFEVADIYDPNNDGAAGSGGSIGDY